MSLNPMISSLSIKILWNNYNKKLLMSLQYKFKNKMLIYQIVKIDLPLENVNKHHMQKLA